MRSGGGEDLIALLRSLPLPEGEDVGYGHARATGGSLTHEDFDALSRRWGLVRRTVVRRGELTRPRAAARTWRDRLPCGRAEVIDREHDPPGTLPLRQQAHLPAREGCP
jgi:hypothetical protein